MTPRPAPPMTDAEKQHRDALLILDAQEDYGASRDMMLAELQFNCGYTSAESEDMYREWSKTG